MEQLKKLSLIILFFSWASFVFAEEEPCHIVTCWPKEPPPCDTSAVYLRASGGLSVVPTITETLVNGASVILQESVYRNSYNVDAAVGYRFLSHWRAELEGTYLSNSLKHNKGSTTSMPINGGYVNVQAALVNLYYDLDLHSRFKPYFGGGVGYANRRYLWQFTNSDPVNTYRAYYTSVAAQGIVGVAYEVQRHFLVSLDYRYLGTASDSFDVTNMAGPPAAATGRYNFAYFSNLVNLGVRFEF